MTWRSRLNSGELVSLMNKSASVAVILWISQGSHVARCGYFLLSVYIHDGLAEACCGRPGGRSTGEHESMGVM